jgi:hypothetical protein
MAFAIVRIDVPGAALGTLKDITFHSGNNYESVQGLIRLLDGILGGAYDAEVRIALRATTIADATLTSDQNPKIEENFNLK